MISVNLHTNRNSILHLLYLNMNIILTKDNIEKSDNLIEMDQ